MQEKPEEGAQVLALPERRPRIRESAARLVRMLLGREECPTDRRARLDARAAVQRAAKERL